MDMKARDVMTTDIVTIHYQATYEDAARILHKHGISGAPVVDGVGNMVGILSEKDLFRVLYPLYRSYYENPTDYLDFEEREAKIAEIRKNAIERFVTTDVLTVDADDPIMKVGGLMIARRVHRLPVLEEEELVGIISRSDIYKRILQEHLGL